MKHSAAALLLSTVLVASSVAPHVVHAQPKSAPAKASAKTASAKTASAKPAPLQESTRPLSSTREGAWSMPDAEGLVQRVYARIIAQDKPGAVPISAYQRRFFGRDATIAAVRRFSGRDITLSTTAFSSVSGWADAPTLQLPLCEGPGCPAPINSIWLAITRIERGELPHELHVWYTTRFAAESPSGPTQNAYAFCERWLRVGGIWKYDGFVRVASAEPGAP
jgi:hypothetical protein